MSVLRKLLDKVVGDGTPDGFAGTLEQEETVVVVAEVRGGGHLVATSLGLWVSTGDGARRIGWHLLSKVTWGDGVLAVVEADEIGEAGDAVLLTDRPPHRYALVDPGKLPHAVHQRVTGSIRSRHHRDLPGGGAWFVQRKVPGRDGIVLQVRADPGTDANAVRTVAAEVAIKIREALQ
ncbi:MAG: hypothetical protein WBA97_34245 [Actinophytocola sp.]|uniref:hypothetical protein n=1 Tax=Actinophytocola sp. TaxID=1872138 RepID=UPI003C741072